MVTDAWPTQARRGAPMVVDAIAWPTLARWGPPGVTDANARPTLAKWGLVLGVTDARA